jgi:hypothetical protein
MRTKTFAAIAALATLGFVQPAMAATAPAKARTEMSAKHHRLAKAKKVTTTTTTTTTAKTRK